MVRKSVWLAVVAAGALLAGRSEALDPPMEYQFEVGARYVTPAGTLSVPFTFFIEKVEDTEKPLSLQPFLAKASYVTADIGVSPAPLSLNVPMKFVLPVAEDSLYITANLGDVLGGAMTYMVGVGYYVTEEFALDIDVLTSAGGLFSLGTLNLQYALEVGDEGALDIQAGVAVAGGIFSTYDVGVMYYVNKELGIGVGLNSASEIDIDVSYWLGPLAIVGNYNLTAGGLMIGVDYRF